jgi:tRNA A-37 threonylcarbamoyl transferase component Bud32
MLNQKIKALIYMKGSGILNYNQYTLNSAFNYFFYNSTFSILSETSLNGLILKLELNDNLTSPLYSITLDESFNKPVRTLILKCILIHKTRESVKNKVLTKATMTDKDFDNEVNVQIDIYNKSITDENYFLEPLCPAIVHIYKNITDEFKVNIYNHFKNKNEKRLMNTFLNLPYQINIIAMEYIDGFDILANSCDPKYEKFALADLMRMHRYGYVHGDYHKSNIMVNTNYTFYGNTPELKGKTIIIDFGRTMPIGKIKTTDLRSVLENEINSLSDSGYWSYVWMSYYYYNCLQNTTIFIDNLIKLRKDINNRNMMTVLHANRTLNTKEKIKKYLIIAPLPSHKLKEKESIMISVGSNVMSTQMQKPTVSAPSPQKPTVSAPSL